MKKNRKERRREAKVRRTTNQMDRARGLAIRAEAMLGDASRTIAALEARNRLLLRVVGHLVEMRCDGELRVQVETLNAAIDVGFAVEDEGRTLLVVPARPTAVAAQRELGHDLDE